MVVNDDLEPGCPVFELDGCWDSDDSDTGEAMVVLTVLWDDEEEEDDDDVSSSSRWSISMGDAIKHHRTGRQSHGNESRDGTTNTQEVTLMWWQERMKPSRHHD